MAENQVYIPKELTTGYGFTAPLGTVLPTDPTAELPDAFKSFGRIGEDGITRSFESDSEDIKDMFGNPVATAKTSDSESFQYKMIDVTEASLSSFYGAGSVSGTAETGFTITSNSNWSVARVYAYRFILEMTDETVTYGLIVIPNGIISERGEQNIKGGALIDHDVTIKANNDDRGNRAYLYISAPQPITPPTPPETYAVTFNLNGGSWEVAEAETVNVPAGESLPLYDETVVGREGYTFAGWAESAESTTAVADPYTPAGDITLYAIWQEAVTLTFDPGSGSGDPFTKEFPKGVPTALPTWAECEDHDWLSSGRHVDGWYTSEGSESDPAADPYTATTAETLYAIWVSD